MRPSRNGFTLLEVLVAILLLVVSLSAVTKSYRMTLGVVGASDHIAHAIINARSLLAAAQAGAIEADRGTLADASRWARHERRRADLVVSGSPVVPMERTIIVDMDSGPRIELRALDWVAERAG